MTERTSNSLVLSTLSHVAIVVLIAFWVSPIARIETLPSPATSFQLVTTAAADLPKPSASSQAKPAVSFIPAPQIPRPAIQPSQPEISPVKTPAPKPVVVTPQKPSTRPVLATSKLQMKFEDFQANHLKKPTPDKTTTSDVRIVAPSFDDADVLKSPTNPAAWTNFAGDAENHPFTAELIQKLQAAYQATGIEDRALSCRIQFALNAQGRVASARILRSSGDSSFDNAVLAAFERVRVSTPPEAFVDSPLTTTFQVAH